MLVLRAEPRCDEAGVPRALSRTGLPGQPGGGAEGRGGRRVPSLAVMPGRKSGSERRWASARASWRRGAESLSHFSVAFSAL